MPSEVGCVAPIGGSAVSTALYFTGISLIGVGGLGDSLLHGWRQSPHHGMYTLSMCLILAGALCWTAGAVLSGQPLWWKLSVSVLVIAISFLLTMKSRFLPSHRWNEPDG
jgi:hypothetical protein